MAAFVSLRSTRFRFVLIAIFAVYLILSITLVAIGFRIKVPDQQKGQIGGRIFAMATIFRIFGAIPAIALGLYTTISWSLQKSGRGFLYVFLLGIPAFFFQAGGSIVDSICSAELSAGIETPHSLVAAAALGIFVSFGSLGAAVFLGMNRKTMAGIAGQPHATVSSFQPLEEEADELSLRETMHTDSHDDSTY